MIDLRWKEWEPLMVMLAREFMDPKAEVARLKSFYYSRILALLDAGVSWKAIRHGRLDNPLRGEISYQLALRAAVERRRTRLGRTKGIRRVNGVRILGLVPPKKHQKEFKRQQELAAKIEENLADDHR